LANSPDPVENFQDKLKTNFVSEKSKRDVVSTLIQSSPPAMLKDQGSDSVAALGAGLWGIRESFSCNSSNNYSPAALSSSRANASSAAFV